jgi:16S rRNA (guanine527-N7)-methyltransferase
MTGGAVNILESGALELGLALTPAQVNAFCRFGDELKKWSAKVNLTAIKADEEIVVKHFLDSLTLLPLLRDAERLADIGSGGGFPAIPLKIVRPDLHVTAIDAVEKKLIFQRHAARLLNLPAFEAIHARAEDLAGKYAGSFDRVVSRAFADIPTFVRIALPLLVSGGVIIAMKGKEGESEAEDARTALDELGLVVSDIFELRLPVSGDGRTLVVIKRV